MRFPKAQAGVSKLFTSQILLLIAAACGIVSGIGLFTAPVLTMIFGIPSIILIIIAFILEIVGLGQAQIDDNYFKGAFIAAIAGIVLSVISGIVTLNVTASSILQFLSMVSSVCVTVFTIMGIRSVAYKLNETDLEKKADRQLLLIVINYSIGVVIQFIGSLMGATESFFIVAGILSIAGSVIEIVTYILFLLLLNNARKTFKK